MTATTAVTTATRLRPGATPRKATPNQAATVTLLTTLAKRRANHRARPAGRPRPVPGKPTPKAPGRRISGRVDRGWRGWRKRRVRRWVGGRIDCGWWRQSGIRRWFSSRVDRSGREPGFGRRVGGGIDRRWRRKRRVRWWVGRCINSTWWREHRVGRWLRGGVNSPRREPGFGRRVGGRIDRGWRRKRRVRWWVCGRIDRGGRREHRVGRWFRGGLNSPGREPGFGRRVGGCIDRGWRRKRRVRWWVCIRINISGRRERWVGRWLRGGVYSPGREPGFGWRVGHRIDGSWR